MWICRRVLGRVRGRFMNDTHSVFYHQSVCFRHLFSNFYNLLPIFYLVELKCFKWNEVEVEKKRMSMCSGGIKYSCLSPSGVLTSPLKYYHTTTEIKDNRNIIIPYYFLYNNSGILPIRCTMYFVGQIKVFRLCYFHVVKFGLGY